MTRILVNQIEIEDVEHVRGHQDETGKVWSMVEKLNVLADQLASKAISEEKCEELQWNMIFGPMLK